MNIKQFLEYKNTCPLCNKNLTAFFTSKKRKIDELNNDWCQVFINLLHMKKYQKAYTAALYIHKYSNSFFVDFFRKDGSLVADSVPITLLHSFQNFIKNVGTNSIYRTCNYCNQYNYNYNNVTLNYLNATIEPLAIHYEYFEIIQTVDDGYQHFRLYNNYIENKSELYYNKSTEYYIPRWNMVIKSPFIKTSLIKFSDNNLINKLNKIVLFS